MAVRPALYVCLLACLLYLTSATPTTASTEDEASTAPQGFHIYLRTTNRQTRYVSVEWDQPNTEVLGYKVMCQKDDSEDVITSPPLSSANTEYIMDNLMTDSMYTICVKAATNDVKQETSSKKADDDKDAEDNLIYNEEECLKARTIPYVRDDSVLAVCIALGYILLMCLIGYICWACHKKRLEAAMEEDEEEEPEEEKIMPDSYRPAYAPPPTGPAVRSSIEDPDIPYITPPVDQLSKRDKQAYDAKV